MNNQIDLSIYNLERDDFNSLTVRQLRAEIRKHDLTRELNRLPNTRKATLISYLISYFHTISISENPTVEFLPITYYHLYASMIIRRVDVEFYPIASLLDLSCQHLRLLALSKNTPVSGPKIIIIRNIIRSLPQNKIYPNDTNYIESDSFWFWLSQDYGNLLNIMATNNLVYAGPNGRISEVAKFLVDHNVPIIHNGQYTGNHLFRLGLTGLRGFAQALEFPYYGYNKCCY